MAAGCVAWEPPPVAPYYEGDLLTAEATFRHRLENADHDWALMANELATCLDAQGRGEEAWRLFYDAGRAMAVWDSSFGEGFRTIVGREDAKEYKGDPYEQCLNSIYTGLLAFAQGAPDNARASFKEAMLRDADSAEDRFKSDLALSFYLAAWASRDMGYASDVPDYLTEAKAARASAVSAGARGSPKPRAFDLLDASNVLLVASVGQGPVKVAGGDEGELAVIASPADGVVGVRAQLDGREVGTAEILADVYFQASTRGGRWLDGVRAGKAFFKGVSRTAGIILTAEALGRRHGKSSKGLLVAGLSALALSGLLRPEADLRCWRTLPDTVQVLPIAAPPGSHDLRIEFLGERGERLPGLTQDCRIEVPANGTLVVHARSIPRAMPVPDSPAPSSEGR